jgi:hypothetical protein
VPTDTELGKAATAALISTGALTSTPLTAGTTTAEPAEDAGVDP